MFYSVLATLFTLVSIIPVSSQMTNGHTYEIDFPASPSVYVGILTAGADGRPTLSTPGIMGAPTAMPQEFGIIMANAPGFTQTYSFRVDGAGAAEPSVLCVVGDVPGASVDTAITRTWSFQATTTIHFPTHVKDGMYVTCNPTAVPTGIPTV